MSIAGAVTTAEPEARSGGSLALLAATVFLSAFLLFQVQPIIGKYIPAVVRFDTGRVGHLAAVLPVDASGRVRHTHTSSSAD